MSSELDRYQVRCLIRARAGHQLLAARSPEGEPCALLVADEGVSSGGPSLGVALQRQPGDHSADASVLMAPFCEASAQYNTTAGGVALLGSPGAANPSCL